MVTGDNKAPNRFPEFLKGPIRSRSSLNQSNYDHNDSFDTTLFAPKQKAPTVARDLIETLADVLTNWLICSATQQPLTIRPVNTSTMTHDGKSEKFEFFEVIFHTIIKM